MGSLVGLDRAQIGSNGQAYMLNVTVKSAVGLGKVFAPTWEMVLSHKKGYMSDREYLETYYRILDQVSEETILALYDWTETNRLTFLCYCPDGVFCHTHLLIDWLTENYPLLFFDNRDKN